VRRVVCHDCGKHYNYDVDDFCPRCGAFTLPEREARISSDGSVVWNDGINERGHQKSFVHAEYHAENRKRSSTPLEGRLPQLKLPRNAVSLKTGKKRGIKKEDSKPAQITAIIVFVVLYLLFKIIS